MCKYCSGSESTVANCADKFNECLAKEFENPEYFKVHHLLVLSYMIQHNKYSKLGLIQARELLKEILFNNITPDEIRKIYREAVNCNNRNFNFTKGEECKKINNIIWDRSILDVRLDTADNYCNDIIKYAKDIYSKIEKIDIQ